MEIKTMENLPILGEKVHQVFETRTRTRDQALGQARQLTRHCANAIRAIHRSERDLAYQHLDAARAIVESLKADLMDFPELFFAGYTQDAIKEYAEASITCALIENKELPMPEELGVVYATYLNGLAESVGELRRRCLDILRHGYSEEAERLLGCMDEVYGLMVTLDYPDAVTNGLRRHTDLMRGIVERTRADLTISLREQKLQELLTQVLGTHPDLAALTPGDSDADHPGL
jgi:translin